MDGEVGLRVGKREQDQKGTQKHCEVGVKEVGHGWLEKRKRERERERERERARGLRRGFWPLGEVEGGVESGKTV